MTSVGPARRALPLIEASPMPSWLPWVGLGTGVLFASLAIAVAAHAPAVAAVDQVIHGWVLAHRTGAESAVARGVARCGSTRVTLPVLLVVAALAPRGPVPVRVRAATGLVVVAVAAGGGLVQATANRAMRTARPDFADWAGAAGGASFPSGHTTSSALFAGCCTWLALHRYRRGRTRLVLIGAAVSFAVAVGVSRVVLGVHWPSDVLGAWLLSIAWLALAASGARRTGLGLPGPASPAGAGVR